MPKVRADRSALRTRPQPAEMLAGTSAPRTEIGAPLSVGAGLAPWGAMFLGDDLEQVPELQWPMSVATYNGMRNDAQCEGLLAGTTLPIRRYKWMIDPNGCDPTRVEELASDLNLPIKGKEMNRRGRAKGRFSHDRHLYHALLALVYGHYGMEQVGEYFEGRWRLTKLAPRPPATIQKLAVNDKGGLQSIQQNVATKIGMMAPEIPVERLVWYAWEQEGSNWFGRSMFRSCFRNWLMKDRLLRIDALKHQRNGMGLPVATGRPGDQRSDLQELQKMAAQVKAGDTSSVALPNGTTMTLEGVRGTLPDTIASIRFHNEEMARRFLMMFMQLGESTHGNRALGEAFIDFFQLNQDQVAGWYADTTTEHVIEDWWDWNVGPDDYTPLLCYERENDPREAFQDIANLVQAGAIQVDDEIEEAIREGLALPKRDGQTKRTIIEKVNPDGTPFIPPADPNADDKSSSSDDKSSTPNPQASRRQERTVQAGAGATSPAIALPDRPLRRQPASYEIAAQVDFLSLDSNWQTKLDTLFEEWASVVIPEQLDELQTAMAATASLDKLAKLEAPALGADLLRSAMDDMFQQGVASALAEAISQEVFIESPDPTKYTTNFSARAGAVDEINARMLGQMAGTKAMRMTGGSMTKAEVAAETRTYLEGLKHAMLRDRLGGALTEAMNTGRRAVFAEGPAADYYASELLDANTCVACSSIDGTHYPSLGEAERDYVGGYVSCAGGDRCRGTLVAVYKEDGKVVDYE